MLKNIQVLRALAAYLVVFAHLGNLLTPLEVNENDLRASAFGIDVFFVISGFIMVFTTAGRKVSPGGFMISRITRVAPLYWLLTLAVFVLALLVPDVFGGTHATLPNLARSLAFIPYLRLDGTVRPLLFLGWTLNYEMFFYLIFAVALHFNGTRARVAFAFLVIFGLFALGRILPDTPILLTFYTRPIIMEFALGMILGLAHAEFGHRRAAGLSAIALVAFALALVCHLTATWLRQELTSAAIATALVATALALETSGRIATWRPVLMMGDASYSLYLIHPFATKPVQWLVPASIPASLLATALALAAATIAGLACYHLIERPLTKLTRGLIKSRGTKLAARGISTSSGETD